MTFGVDRATVRFGDITALDDVSVDVPGGAMTAVVGADGAGKTTLLRTLAGLVEPVSGTSRRPVALRLGYFPALAGSWNNLTVAENMAFVGAAYGLSGPELSTRSERILDGAGLAGATGKLAGHLSGGMRTKLGVALALLHEPDLLILDEPTTGVDPVSRVDVWRMISEAIARGAAAIISTTYMDEAERASSVVLLGEGKVLLSGPPESLTSSVPGSIVALTRPTNGDLAWRVGRNFHEWIPDGHPSGRAAIAPDLEDACIVAELERSATPVSGST